jgi:hypothetical protein
MGAVLVLDERRDADEEESTDRFVDLHQWRAESSHLSHTAGLVRIPPVASIRSHRIDDRLGVPHIQLVEGC